MRNKMIKNHIKVSAVVPLECGEYKRIEFMKKSTD